MSEKTIRQWYEKNGMMYLEQDWGPTLENGESASLQAQDPERVGREWVAVMDPSVMAELEGTGSGELRSVFEDRDPIDRTGVEALEDFFETHLPIERGKRQDALEAFLYDRASLGEVAAERGVSKQAVSQQRHRLFAWVTRELAGQWPDPEGTAGQRAWAVFASYWRDRFGVDYPDVEVA